MRCLVVENSIGTELNADETSLRAGNIDSAGFGRPSQETGRWDLSWF